MARVARRGARARGRRDFPDEREARLRRSPTIKKWLGVFLYRFFEISQFKRSALPNGPKVVSGGNLSPRGDWRAPSDGNANVWLEELEAKLSATLADEHGSLPPAGAVSPSGAALRD